MGHLRDTLIEQARRASLFHGHAGVLLRYTDVRPAHNGLCFAWRLDHGQMGSRPQENFLHALPRDCEIMKGTTCRSRSATACAPVDWARTSAAICRAGRRAPHEAQGVDGQVMNEGPAVPSTLSRDMDKREMVATKRRLYLGPLTTTSPGYDSITSAIGRGNDRVVRHRDALRRTPKEHSDDRKRTT